MTLFSSIRWRGALLLLAVLLLTMLLLNSTASLAQNIGIGTNTPTEALDVNGNLRVRGLSRGNGRLLTVLPDGTLSAGEQLGALSGLGTNSQFLPEPVVPTLEKGNYSRFAAITSYGRYLYFLGSGEVRVYDAANPTQPVAVGVATLSRPHVGQMVMGLGYSYILTPSYDLDVYRITTPTTFTYVSTVSTRPPGATSNNFWDMALSGNYLYFLSYYGGLTVGGNATLVTLDLTTPAAPVLMNNLDVPASGGGRVVQIAVNEPANTLYVSGRNFSKFQLATPTTPTTYLGVGTATYTQFTQARIQGGILYALDDLSNTQLRLFDVSDNPASPRGLGSIPTPARVDDFDFLGRYAFFLGNPSLYAALVAAPSVLGFDPSGNITTQSPVLPSNADNLGNHTAVQNLNLATFQLVGSGGSKGISIANNGYVGIGNPTPTVALDVAGDARATSLTVTGAAEAATVEASTSVRTPVVLTPTTGSHNMLVAAYGSIGSTGTVYGSTGNYTVSHTSGSNIYSIHFTPASGLSATDLSEAVVTLTLYGNNVGFATYSASTAGTIDVIISNVTGLPIERGFAFHVYLP